MSALKSTFYTRVESQVSVTQYLPVTSVSSRILNKSPVGQESLVDGYMSLPGLNGDFWVSVLCWKEVYQG